MSYPQQGQYPPAYPPPAQPGYPPQQGYPPPGQYPPPQGYAPPPPQYAPPPQQYAPPQPAEPLARGTIDDFFDQPAASGKSLSFDNKPPGTAYAGVVARTITHADIQVATDKVTRQARRHPDGRLKFNMIVPLILAPSAEHPDGRASWYVKAGAEREELSRAMEAAGVPPGTPPEQGALITITYTGDRPIPGLNPQKVKRVTYQRPQNAANLSETAMRAQPEPNGQDIVTGNGNFPPQDQPPWTPAPGTPPQYAAEQYVQAAAPGQQLPPPVQQQAPVQQQPPQPPPMQAPPGLTPEQLAALAAITGQQA